MIIIIYLNQLKFPLKKHQKKEGNIVLFKITSSVVNLLGNNYPHIQTSDE